MPIGFRVLAVLCCLGAIGCGREEARVPVETRCASLFEGERALIEILARDDIESLRHFSRLSGREAAYVRLPSSGCPLLAMALRAEAWRCVAFLVDDMEAVFPGDSGFAILFALPCCPDSAVRKKVLRLFGVALLDVKDSSFQYIGVPYAIQEQFVEYRPQFERIGLGERFDCFMEELRAAVAEAKGRWAICREEYERQEKLFQEMRGN